jgi:hypothetical protein
MRTSTTGKRAHALDTCALTGQVATLCVGLIVIINLRPINTTAAPSITFLGMRTRRLPHFGSDGAELLSFVARIDAARSNASLQSSQASLLGTLGPVAAWNRGCGATSHVRQRRAYYAVREAVFRSCFLYCSLSLNTELDTSLHYGLSCCAHRHCRQHAASTRATPFVRECSSTRWRYTVAARAADGEPLEYSEYPM